MDRTKKILKKETQIQKDNYGMYSWVYISHKVQDSRATIHRPKEESHKGDQGVILESSGGRKKGNRTVKDNWIGEDIFGMS